MNKVLFSHKSDLWKTPKKIYTYYTKELKCFDPCPTNPKKDGLKIDWKEKNFVNPPYSKIKEWVAKAIEEHKKGHRSIMLLPARTDTKWFETLHQYGCTFTFITGRLHFNEEGPAPFPSMFVVLNGGAINYIDLIMPG